MPPIPGVPQGTLPAQGPQRLLYPPRVPYQGSPMPPLPKVHNTSGVHNVSPTRGPQHLTLGPRWRRPCTSCGKRRARRCGWRWGTPLGGAEAPGVLPHTEPRRRASYPCYHLAPGSKRCGQPSNRCSGRGAPDATQTGKEREGGNGEEGVLYRILELCHSHFNVCFTYTS